MAAKVRSMRRNATAYLFLCLIGLTGCGGVVDEHGVRYSSGEDLSADHKRMDENIYQSIQSLPEPLAESGIFLIPDFTYFHKKVSSLPWKNKGTPERLRWNAQYLEYKAVMFTRFSEKRNLFEEQRVERVSYPSDSPADVRSDTDTIVRYSFENDGMHLTVEKDGRRRETLRPWHWNPDYPDYESRRRSMLWALEDLLAKW